MKEVIVTTSWDDGHKLDVRLAALLKKYDIKATFYIAPRDHELSATDRLTDDQIRALSRSFEVGAHTMTHPRLPRLPDNVAEREIRSSKRYLEKVIGKPVTTFCYPGGSYRARHVPIVRRAGFSYARTVRRFHGDWPSKQLEAGTSVNTYNHYQDLWKIAKFAHFNPRKIAYYFHWHNLAKAMFDRVRDHGGVFHLWGHSWEVDGHGDWEKLEHVLRYIAGKKDVQYAANGELALTRPRRLLIAAPYFPPHLGGSEFYAYNIARLLERDYGWKVWVATSGGRGFSGAERTAYKGIRVYKLPYWFKVSNTPINPLWVFELRRIIKRERITVINAHTPVPFLADIAMRATGSLPKVLTYHMVPAQKGRRLIDAVIGCYGKFLLPPLFRSVMAIVCSSDGTRASLPPVFHGKSTTITPAVDTTFFVPNAQKTPTKKLLFVGSLNKSDDYKGLNYLIESLPAVAAKHPEVTLLVVGDGDGRTGYEALAAQLGTGRRVRFIGGQYGRALLARFQAADMLVLPSLTESFGMVAVEAMSCGLPVVGTCVDGIPFVVQDGKTGYLVAPADPGALADKIVYLLDHPEIARKFGVRARERAVRDFDWRSRAEQTNQVLLAPERGPT